MKRIVDQEHKPDGDGKWLERIYLEFDRKLLLYIMSHDLHLADAQDLCQEVWQVVSKHPQRIRQAEKPEAMLLKIAHDKIVDFFRSNSHHTENRLQSDPPEIESLPDPRGGRERRLELELEEALDALSEKLRETIELYIQEGLSEIEIAHRLGIPEGTVYSRIHNIVRTYRKYFKDE